MPIQGEYVVKQGEYYLLDDGYWVRENGLAWSGTYNTADGVVFTLAGSGGGGGGNNYVEDGYVEANYVD